MQFFQGTNISVYVISLFLLPTHTDTTNKVILLTNVFRNQPQNPKHITLQTHVTSILPNCISITHRDLTKETIPSRLMGSSSCPSSSIDHAEKIKVLDPMTPTGVKYNGLKVEGIE